MDENGTEQTIEAKREDARKREDTLTGAMDGDMLPEPKAPVRKNPEPPASLQQTPNDATTDASVKKHRTVGNKVFDAIVWPSVAFGVVFAFSAWLLHTTKFGTGAFKVRYDGWVESATKWLSKNVYKKLPVEEVGVKAKHHVDVLISFFAGTLLVSPIKIFEDHRASIAKKIDQFFGTTPKDPDHYKNEPKQSWLSVLGGRALTFGIVLGVSTLGGKYIDRVLEGTATKFTNYWQRTNPKATEGALKAVREWSFVSAFEGFYTAVCAVLLYVISRAIARNTDTKKEQATATASEAPNAPVIAQLPTVEPEKDMGKPSPRVGSVERIAPVSTKTAELGAIA